MQQNIIQQVTFP